ASLSAQNGAGQGLSLGGDGTIQSTRNNTLTIGGNTTGNIILANNTTLSQALTVAGAATFSSLGSGVAHLTSGLLSVSNVLLGSEVSGILPVANGGSPLDAGSGAIFTRNITQDFLLGGQATSSAKFAFTNVSGGTPTASISGAGNNALSLDAAGTIGTTNEQTLSLGTAATGDINLVIGAGNNLRINGVAGANVSANCVNVSNGIVTSSATCPSAAANFIWQTGSGAIFEGNITQDLLIGSLATSSAKFAVINVNNGTPVASLSAGTAGGAYLTASGILATTAKQSLVLGDANTGNVIVNNLGTGIVHSTNGLLSSSAVDLASGDVTG